MATLALKEPVLLPLVSVSYQVIIVIVMVSEGHMRSVLYKFILFFTRLSSMRFL